MAVACSYLPFPCLLVSPQFQIVYGNSRICDLLQINSEQLNRGSLGLDLSDDFIFFRAVRMVFLNQRPSCTILSIRSARPFAFHFKYYQQCNSVLIRLTASEMQHPMDSSHLHRPFQHKIGDIIYLDDYGQIMFIQRGKNGLFSNIPLGSHINKFCNIDINTLSQQSWSGVQQVQAFGVSCWANRKYDKQLQLFVLELQCIDPVMFARDCLAEGEWLCDPVMSRVRDTDRGN